MRSRKIGRKFALWFTAALVCARKGIEYADYGEHGLEMLDQEIAEEQGLVR